MNTPYDKRTPTEMKEGKLTLSAATARRRRRDELYKAAEAINGSTKTAADIGLVHTLVKKCSVATITNVFFLVTLGLAKRLSLYFISHT